MLRSDSSNSLDAVLRSVEREIAAAHDSSSPSAGPPLSRHQQEESSAQRDGYRAAAMASKHSFSIDDISSRELFDPVSELSDRAAVSPEYAVSSQPLTSTQYRPFSFTSHETSAAASDWRAPLLIESLSSTEGKVALFNREDESAASSSTQTATDLIEPISLSAATSSSAPVRKRRRQRGPAGLSAEERADLKRRQHRDIDTQRRHREQAAVRKLQQLIRDKALTSLPEYNQLEGRLDVNEEEEEEDVGTERETYTEEGGETSRKDKVSILEQSAQQIQRMRQLIDHLAEKCRGEQITNRQLFIDLQAANNRLSTSSPSSSSSALTPTYSRIVDYHEANQSVYSSFFLSASVGLYHVLAQSGKVVDLNNRCLELTGWRREFVIDRLLTAPYHLIVKESSQIQREEMTQLDESRYLMEGSDGRAEFVRSEKQYDRTIRLQKELYRGLHSQVTLVWRCLLRNRKLHEVTVTQWIGSMMGVDDGQGGMMQRPAHVVGLVRSIQCVD